jgi:hypothetical protein
MRTDDGVVMRAFGKWDPASQVGQWQDRNRRFECPLSVLTSVHPDKVLTLIHPDTKRPTDRETAGEIHVPQHQNAIQLRTAGHGR